MLKLIKMEWAKNSLEKQIRNAAVMILCLTVFCVFMSQSKEVQMELDAVMSVYMIVKIFISISFTIFSSAMISSFIINAYKNKTMSVMFSYPIKRKKIVLSQMLAVWIFNFAAMLFSYVVISAAIILVAKFRATTALHGLDLFSPVSLMNITLSAFLSVSMSFIGMFVGMQMKSRKAPIITAFIIIFVVEGQIGQASLRDNPLLPIFFTIVALICSFMTLRTLETRDLM